MEANEALEQLEKTHEAAQARERFTRFAAVLIAVLAALLAVATLAANQAEETIILDQQQASDAYNELQANSLKRHGNENTAAELRALAAGTPQQPAAEQEAQRLDEAVRNKYRPNEDRLLPVARGLERERDRAEARHRDLQLSEAGFQIAIVLCSVAILARRSPLVWLGVLLGVAGLLLLLNSWPLLVTVPRVLPGGG
jgi:hypothetical protein